MIKRDTKAAPNAEDALITSGVGSSNSATIDDIIVTILAEKLQYPKTDAANIVGISYTLAIKLMVKAELIPNLAMIMKMKIRFVSSIYLSRSKDPTIETM